MKIIAHRGLTDGPDSTKENTHAQIEEAVSNGFDCEVDLWIVDNVLYLGHDAPGEKTTVEWICNPAFWIHAKNELAFKWLSTTNLHYFWHETDHFVLTSKKVIWTYTGKPILPGAVCVMPENFNYTWEELKRCSAICTDYPHKYYEELY